MQPFTIVYWNLGYMATIGYRLRPISVHDYKPDLRCYISRVENGRTVPAVETLEKMACALEVPLCLLLYEGKELPASRVTIPRGIRNDLWVSSGKDSTLLARLGTGLSRMNMRDRILVMSVAAHIANWKARKESPR